MILAVHSWSLKTSDVAPLIIRQKLDKSPPLMAQCISLRGRSSKGNKTRSFFPIGNWKYYFYRAFIIFLRRNGTYLQAALINRNLSSLIGSEVAIRGRWIWFMPFSPTCEARMFLNQTECFMEIKQF